MFSWYLLNNNHIILPNKEARVKHFETSRAYTEPKNSEYIHRPFTRVATTTKKFDMQGTHYKTKAILNQHQNVGGM